MGTESGFAALADGDLLPVAAPAPAAPSWRAAAAPAVEDDTESRFSRQFTAEWLALLFGLADRRHRSIAWSLLKAHESLDATERDRLRVQARVVDDNVGQQLDGMNRALASVARRLPRHSGVQRLDACSRCA